MKTSERLQSLIDEGLIDGVQRQLKSDKEAEVYVATCQAEVRAVMVYKSAQQRSLRQAVDHTENRKATNSRQTRAMTKGTRFGKALREEAWQSAEVDALDHLATAGPVIIDLPQAVDAPGNLHVPRMLLRDAANLRALFGNFAPELRDTQFGAEIWNLYAGGRLTPEVPLSGRYAPEPGAVDLAAVMREIDDARAEEQARRLRMA